MRDGAAKGKIARLFRTVRDQFLSRALDLASFEGLNRQFTAWVEEHYNAQLHSVLGLSPLDRFALDRNRVRFLPPNEANDELFFVEEERHVRADNTFSFKSVRFESPRHLPERTIQIRFERNEPRDDKPGRNLTGINRPKRLDRSNARGHVFGSMSGGRPFFLPNLLSVLIPLLGLFGCSSTQPPSQAATAQPLFTPPPSIVAPSSPTRTATDLPRVMLGIDVLEADGFGAVKGKRLGLLTHPAGVNRRGTTTIDVLRRAQGVKLVALYGPEHGIHGDAPAEVVIGNSIDQRTGLPVYSLYGQFRRPTKEMLKGIDAMVIDLQDIGTRSYTYASAMKWTMEACFENNVEVVVLDRPNPLGGLKVGGPPLDPHWSTRNYVGAFRVPYVHGLTIGELARLAKESPGVMEVPDAVRARGKLTVVPMRGWTRSMRWPETGLTFVPTSPGIQDWAAVQGYPMVGLGAYFDARVKFDIGFRHGVGRSYIFRGLSHTAAKLDVLEKELRALNFPGVQFRRVSAPDRDGKPATGLYIEITDYDDWHPVELNFHMMRIACKLSPRNPFQPAPGRDFSGFLRHMGSQAFLNDIAAKGARVDVEAWLKTWREQALAYQEQTKRYWLYR